MQKIEKLFDINILLMTLFSSLETISDEKRIELIYDMQATIPRELRGDSAVLLRLLTKILIFVFQNTDKKEIILSLEAPEDFMYEEPISFKIQKTNIDKEKILKFLETNLSKDLEILEGKIIYEGDADWEEYISQISHTSGARQIFELRNRNKFHKLRKILKGLEEK